MDDSAAIRQRSEAYTAWMRAVAAQPWRYDFYQVLRHIESLHPHLPRLGEAVRPADEPIRVAQPPELSFAPATLQQIQTSAEGVPRLLQRAFGLLGPNGPMPIHITELARDRSTHHADPALQRFLDMLTHRFALLFYRAWAAAQPAVSLDRAGDTTYARRIGALLGIGSETLLARDALGDAPKLHFAGRLARHARDADGLQAWCRAIFQVPLHVEQWCGHWMALDREERTRLRGRDACGLGRGAVLGASVWDVQHKFRIVIGPLPLARYLEFMPGRRELARLHAMVRQWVGLEFAWDLRLVLAREQVPRTRLAAAGSHAMLGRSTWLGHYQHDADAIGMTLDVESVMRPQRFRNPTNAASENLHE